MMQSLNVLIVLEMSLAHLLAYLAESGHPLILVTYTRFYGLLNLVTYTLLDKVMSLIILHVNKKMLPYVNFQQKHHIR